MSNYGIIKLGFLKFRNVIINTCTEFYKKKALKIETPSERRSYANSKTSKLFEKIFYYDLLLYYIFAHGTKPAGRLK